MKIIEAFELYKNDYMVTKNRSYSTLEHFEYYRNALIFHVGNKPVEDLSVSDVTSVLKALLDSGRSSNTVRNYAGAYRSVLRYLRLRGYRVIDYELIPIAKREEAKVDWVTTSEVRRLVAIADTTRAKFIISFLHASGIRVSEFCQLKRSDIHGRTFSVLGKGGKVRLCFLDARALYYMDEYLLTRTDDSPWLTISPQTGERISPATVQFIIKRARKMAHLDKRVTPHTFRHGFATDLLNNGAAIQDVSEMLGHSSVQTTMIYRHITDANLQRKYEKSHSF